MKKQLLQVELDQNRLTVQFTRIENAENLNLCGQIYHLSTKNITRLNAALNTIFMNRNILDNTQTFPPNRIVISIPLR